MTSTLLIVQLTLTILIIIVILLQKSSSMGLGAYSGSNESMFGAKGPAAFLTKFTFLLGALFIANTLFLGWLYNQEKQESIINDKNISSLIPPSPENKAPGAPDTDSSLDKDNDGITDDKDNCKDTLPGVKIDSNGCAKIDEPKNLGIVFGKGDDKIKANDTKKFDKYVQYLTQNPGSKVIIEAHTDSLGDGQANMDLSIKRAKNAKEALIGKGIESSRITAKGLGETQPIYSNDTEENRKLNRRVTARIVK